VLNEEVSITPLHIDMTARDMIPELSAALERN
jgi:hypothetical protein